METDLEEDTMQYTRKLHIRNDDEYRSDTTE